MEVRPRGRLKVDQRQTIFWRGHRFSLLFGCESPVLEASRFAKAPFVILVGAGLLESLSN